MAMTERERVLNRLRQKIETAHEVNYDFVYIPVGTAKLIVKLLEEKPDVHIVGMPANLEVRRIWIEHGGKD